MNLFTLINKHLFLKEKTCANFLSFIMFISKFNKISSLAHSCWPSLANSTIFIHFRTDIKAQKIKKPTFFQKNTTHHFPRVFIAQKKFREISVFAADIGCRLLSTFVFKEPLFCPKENELRNINKRIYILFSV